MTAVTVYPVGHRMETLIPVPVAFGHDVTGRRTMRFLLGVLSACSLVRIDLAGRRDERPRP